MSGTSTLAFVIVSAAIMAFGVLQPPLSIWVGFGLANVAILVWLRAFRRKK